MAIDIDSHLSQARAYAEAGDKNNARNCLLDILQQDPDDKTALLMLGGEYFDADKLSAAKMIFERLILLSPGTGEVSIALFNTLWKSNRKEEALEEIKRFMANSDHQQEAETIKQYAAITQDITDI